MGRLGYQSLQLFEGGRCEGNPEDWFKELFIQSWGCFQVRYQTHQNWRYFDWECSRIWWLVELIFLQTCTESELEKYNSFHISPDGFYLSVLALFTVITTSVLISLWKGQQQEKAFISERKARHLRMYSKLALALFEGLRRRVFTLSMLTSTKSEKDWPRYSVSLLPSSVLSQSASRPLSAR